MKGEQSMYQMFVQSASMNAAACAEVMFSCANNTALLLDAAILASILFTLLNLRLRSLLGLLLLNNRIRMKGAVPSFA